MNRIYKVIWSKVKNCYIVVSEIAKSHSKPVSMKLNSGKTVAAVLAVTALCAGMTGIAQAATNTEGADQSVAIEQSVQASENAVADGIGSNMDAESLTNDNIGEVADEDLDPLTIKLSKERPIADSRVALAQAAATYDGWTLAVGIGPDAITDKYGTASGESTKISSGDTVTLQAGSGIKLTQDGSKVQIGLKFLDMAPAGWPFNDAKANGGASLAIGQNSVAEGQQGTAVGFKTYAGQYSFAGGTEAEATTSSVAIGNYAKAMTTKSVAIGGGKRKVANKPSAGYKKIDSDFAVAIGNETYVGENSDGANALGANAEVTSSEYGTALGSYAIVSSSDKAIAAGGAANVTSSKQSTAIGAGSKVNESVNATAMGASSNISGSTNATALGASAKVSSSQNATALGTGVSVTNSAYTTATGTGATVSGSQYATAMGHLSKAEGSTYATTIGAYSGVSTSNYGLALGTGSKVNNTTGGVGLGAFSVADRRTDIFGYNPTTGQSFALNAEMKAAFDVWQAAVVEYNADPSNTSKRQAVIDTGKQYRTLTSEWVSGNGAVSVGNSADSMTRQIINVAAGSQDTDAVNLAQLKAVNTKVDDNKISYVSINTKKTANKNNDQAGVPDDKSSRDAAVIGSNNITTGLGNWNLVVTGFGNTIKNTSYDATSDSVTEKLVNNAYVYGNENIAQRGIVIGRYNVITDSGLNSTADIAIGTRNKNYGTRSINIGVSTLTNGVDSLAVGFSAKAPVTDAIAIGGYTEANSVGSIALGQGAVANAGGGVALGYESLANRSAGSIGYFSTLGSTERAAIAEKLGKTAEYNQLVSTINSYSDLAAKEAQYRSYISERQKNQDLLSAEVANLSTNAEGSAAYNASLAKIKEYQRLIKENNDGENSLSGIVSTNNPDYQALLKARTDLRNMFSAYMSTESAISVGNTSKGIYRQITGVAAGSEDTDAVNVAQLKDLEVAGLNFKGDGDTVVHRDLADTLNVVGGNTDTTSLTEGNIGVVADDTTGTLNVKLAKNLTMGDGSITFAPTGAKDADGNALVQGQDGKWYSDLSDATYDATNNIYTKADGTTVSAVDNPVVSSVKLTNTGLDNGGNKITNVAKGVDSTDAVNMEQFNEISTKVDKGWTLAVGRGPDASSSYLATAEGDPKKISSGDTVTLQAGRGVKLKQDGAGVQIGLKYIDMDSAGDTYYDATASAGGALAVGQNSVADGHQGTAIGYATHAGQYSFAGGTQAEADMSSVAIGDYAKANNSGSVAIGSGIRRVANDPASEYKKVDSEYGVAIGYETYVGENSKNSTALGTHAKLDSSRFAVAIGNNATVTGSDYATAIGHNTQVTNVTNGVALGSYSIVDRNAGVVGYDASGAAHSSDKTGTWKSVMGAVSIGQNGYTRQITNVAAGSADSDAVNVAQLKAAGTAGLNFKGDGDTVVHRDLADTLNITGGITDADSLTEDNIGVVADDAKGTLNVRLAKNLTMGDGSITFNKVILSSTGLDNGGNKITNVAKGVDSTDAVNMEQFNEVSNKLDKGWTLAVARGSGTTSDADVTVEGDSKKIASGDTVTLKAGRGIKLQQDGSNVQIGLKFIDVEPGGGNINAAQATGAASLAIGQNSKVMEQRGTAVGYNAVSGQHSVAIGADSEANMSSVAIGSYATAKLDGSIAIGSGRRVIENDPTGGYKKADSAFVTVVGDEAYVGENSKDASVFGARAEVNGSEHATAVGSFSNISNSLRATAIGNTATITDSERATALGNTATVTKSAYAMALGSFSKVENVAQGVALGAYSLANRNPGVLGYDPSTGKSFELTQAMKDASAAWQAAYNAYNADRNNEAKKQAFEEAGNNYRKLTGAWQSNTGAVSVGNSTTGLSRQITNVAAGSADSDAVNVAQLKAAKVEVVAGTNIKTVDTDSSAGYTKYTVNAIDTQVTDGAVKYGTDGTGTITLNTDANGTKGTVTVSGLTDKYVDAVTFENNTLTIKRNDDESFKVDNLATKADLTTEAGKVNLKFTGDDTSENGTITKINGAILNILGGASEFTAADNIGVVKENDALKVKLAKDISMGNGSVTFAGAKDDSGNTLVQGQDGKWYTDLTDAVYDADSQTYTKDGTTLTAVENPTVSEVKLSNTGLDNGGNKITNVAAGTEDTDIVNLKQLKGSTIESGKLKYTDAGVGTMTLTMQDGSTVEIGGLQDKYITKASLDGNKLILTRNDDEKFEIDKIATTDDLVGENSKVNLKFTGDDTSEDAVITKKNGETLNIFGGADKDKLTENNIGVVSDNGNLRIKLAKDLSGIDSARIGGTLKDGEITGGIYIANQDVKYNGASGKTESGLYVTGLANTAWNPSTDGIVSGRAATEDQLKAAYDGLSSTIGSNKVVAGKNITVTELENGAGTEVALSDDLSFGDKDGNNVAIKGNEGIISAGDGGTNKVVVDGTKSTVTAGTGDNTVNVDGAAGQVTIGDGTNGKLVMGNQEVAVKNADGTAKVDADGNPVTEKGKFITGLDNTTWNPDENGYVPDRAATEGQLKDVADSVKDITDTIGVGTRDFAGDSGEAKVKLGEALNLKGGADVNKLSEGNIGVVGNGSNGLDIKLAKDIKGLDSIETKEITVTEKANIGNVSISNDNVTIGTGDSKTIITNEHVMTGSVMTGNTTINNDGLTIVNEDSSKNITINNNNVNMGGNAIHNVGEATEATDAINKGQFDRTVAAIGTGMNQMNSRIGKLDSRVNRVGAGAAALAALHPLEYSSDSKWEVTAGVGNYRGANAVALGAFYRPNYDTMVSIGSSYGGGENMVNAGVTWRIGEGETGTYPSKQAMAQRINNLESALSQQHEQIEAQNQKIEELMAAMAELTKNK